MYVQAILYVSCSFLLAGCLATDFYITSPYDAISWEAGKTAKITWDIIPGGPEVSSVNVDLMDGDDANAHVLQTVAGGLSPGSTSVEWKVPDNFPPTKTVFVRVSGHGGESYVYRFSHRFVINGANSNDEKQNKAPEEPEKVAALSVTPTSATASSSTKSSTTKTSKSTSTSHKTGESTTLTTSIPSVKAPKGGRNAGGVSLYCQSGIILLAMTVVSVGYLLL